MPRAKREASTASSPSAARAFLKGRFPKDWAIGIVEVSAAMDAAAGSDHHAFRQLVKQMQALKLDYLLRLVRADVLRLKESRSQRLRQLAVEAGAGIDTSRGFPNIERTLADLERWFLEGQILLNQLRRIDFGFDPLHGHEDLGKKVRTAWAFDAAAAWVTELKVRDKASVMAHLLIASDVETTAGENDAWTRLRDRCQKALRRPKKARGPLRVLRGKLPPTYQARQNARMRDWLGWEFAGLLKKLEAGDGLGSFSPEDQQLLQQIAGAYESSENSERKRRSVRGLR